MAEVALLKCEDYNPGRIREILERGLGLLGGIGSIIKPGDKVLIKPNMLSAKDPDKHITTHPAIVEAVGRMVLDQGGRPVVGDSPALGRFSRVAEKTGVKSACLALGIETAELKHPRKVDTPESSVFKHLEIASQALDADVVINLGKVKTHSLMLLTLGVKNLFGTIVAQRKGEWHLAIGLDRDSFAALLLDIYLTLRPALTILDGVYGMEGRGPTNGQIRPLGFLGLSRDAVSLDMTVCRLLGARLDHFPLYRAALDRKLISPGAAGIEVLGDAWSEMTIKDFKLPDLETPPGGSNPVSRFISRQLVSRPVHRPENCIMCGQCEKICPADALAKRGEQMVFDYNACIRCYCCQEICPQDAIGFRKGWLAGLLSLIGR